MIKIPFTSRKPLSHWRADLIDSAASGKDWLTPP